MTMREAISAIQQKHKVNGVTINPPASQLELQNFERKVGFELPADFKDFYSICNGFDCIEDIFRIIALGDILEDEQHYGDNWFHFAEYMIYSDMWSLRRRDDGQYEIFNQSDVEVVLTSSLQEFLVRFLQ